MRKELQNLEQIERFLLNKMTPEERSSFKKEIESSQTLKSSVETQRLILERLKVVSLKQDIKKAHLDSSHTNGSSGKLKGFIVGAIVITVITVSIYFLRSEPSIIQQEKTVAVKQTNLNTIHPPIDGIDVPFLIDTVIAEESSILTYKSGSMIIIPENSFIDNKGKVIKGEVELKFREFPDASSIYLSGIPMNYSIDNKDFTFESASMCEVLAFKNEEKLRINPSKKIEIIQSTYTLNNSFNLYRFDKEKGRWLDKGKDTPFDINVEDKSLLREMVEVSSEEVSMPIKPKLIKPQKANPKANNFTIEYEKEEFPELDGFKNVTFEINENLSNFKDGDENIEWEDVKISKSKFKNKFQVDFIKTTTNQERTYIVDPVFEGDNYDVAITSFNKRLNEYDLVLKKKKEDQRLVLERQEKLKKQMLLEERKIDSMNQAIDQRNAETLVNNEKIESRNEAIKHRVDSIRKVNMEYREQMKEFSILIAQRFTILAARTIPKNVKEKLMADVISIETLLKFKPIINQYIDVAKAEFKNRRKTEEIRSSLRRSYEIDNFGIWNTDCPTTLPKGREFLASFTIEGRPIVGSVNLIDKGRRAVYNYPLSNFKNFRIDPKSENLAWTVESGRIYYFNDFKDVVKVVSSNRYTFKLEYLDIKYNNYSELRAALNDL